MEQKQYIRQQIKQMTFAKQLGLMKLYLKVERIMLEKENLADQLLQQ